MVDSGQISQLRLSFSDKEKSVQFDLQRKVKDLLKYILLEEQTDQNYDEQDQQIIMEFEKKRLPVNSILLECGVKNNSILKVTYQNVQTRGGQSLGIKLPSMKGDNEVKGELGKYDPNYNHLNVTKGLNFKAFCERPSCKTTVYLQIGLFEVDVALIKTKQVCSKCGEKLRPKDIKNILFSKDCFWKFQYMDEEMYEPEIGFGSNPNQNGYVTFKEEEEKQVNYTYLYILCAESQKIIDDHKEWKFK